MNMTGWSTDWLARVGWELVSQWPQAPCSTLLLYCAKNPARLIVATTAAAILPSLTPYAWQGLRKLTEALPRNPFGERSVAGQSPLDPLAHKVESVTKKADSPLKTEHKLRPLVEEIQKWVDQHTCEVVLSDRVCMEPKRPVSDALLEGLSEKALQHCRDTLLKLEPGVFQQRKGIESVASCEVKNQLNEIRALWLSDSKRDGRQFSKLAGYLGFQSEETWALEAFFHGWRVERVWSAILCRLSLQDALLPFSQRSGDGNVLRVLTTWDLQTGGVRSSLNEMQQKVNQNRKPSQVGVFLGQGQLLPLTTLVPGGSISDHLVCQFYKKLPTCVPPASTQQTRAPSPPFPSDEDFVEVSALETEWEVSKEERGMLIIGRKKQTRRR